MDNYIDNIANTATNKKTALKQFVATNSKQEAGIDTHASTITKLSGQVKTLNKQVNPIKEKLDGTNNTPHKISKYQGFVRDPDDSKFVKGKCYWPHGYRLKLGLNSGSCTFQKDDHNEKVTHKNIMGGFKYDKGWDD